MVYCNNDKLRMGSNPPRASFGLTMSLAFNIRSPVAHCSDFLTALVGLCQKWTVMCCNVLYKPKNLFHHCSLFMCGRWYDVRPLCFRVGSNRQHKASSRGIVAALVLSFSTCSTNPICLFKKFNEKQEPHDEAYFQGIPFLSWTLPFIMKGIIWILRNNK